MIKRLFVSINIPEDLAGDLRDISDNLAAELKHSADFKLTENYNYHFTIKFLGSQEPGSVPIIEKCIKNALEGVDKALEKTISLKRVDYATGNRMIWVFAKSAWMESFAKNLETELQKANIGYDPKPFTSHITLVRIKDFFDKKPKIAQRVDKQMEIKTVSLMESVLTSDGPKYYPEVEIEA